MDHPLHDDSHLGEAIDNDSDNREILIGRIIKGLQRYEVEEMAKASLEAIFKKDDRAFDEAWNLYIEGQ
ncbi:hypothetical protein [uncultured Mediterranean phage uvMED]|nr:hypothetical protein [uncultured Mediterranean phage uvMED]